MNKPSDRLESFEHNMEAYNFAIDIQKQRIQAELKWLDDNYDNIDALKYYFLSIMNFNNQLQYAQYAARLNACSSQQIQGMVDQRASLLYYNLQVLDSKKFENKPLKAIIQMLKTQNR